MKQVFVDLTGYESAAHFGPPTRTRIPDDIPEDSIPDDIPEASIPDDIPEDSIPDDIPEDSIPDDIPEDSIPDDIPEDIPDTISKRTFGQMSLEI